VSELRWNPLLGEWVATATHRQSRTFLPPADFCPLCPTQPGGFPTEVPESSYDVAVFENRFPSLKSNPEAPAVEGTELCPVRPGQGVCEVVLYSPRHTSTLAAEPGRCLMCHNHGEERRDGRRLVAENESFAAYVPFFARYPYEIHNA
jgi:UDPglucose--hexose-1-phosphate uridylyltransferase